MVSRVKELIDWEKRLVGKGLEGGVASEIIVGLERLFVGPEDIDELNRRLERTEEMIKEMRLELVRAHEQRRAAEREAAELRRELREERRAMRAWR